MFNSSIICGQVLLFMSDIIEVASKPPKKCIARIYYDFFLNYIINSDIT